MVIGVGLLLVVFSVRVMFFLISGVIGWIVGCVVIVGVIVLCDMIRDFLCEFSRFICVLFMWMVVIFVNRLFLKLLRMVNGILGFFLY